jgi:hypothetical protein
MKHVNPRSSVLRRMAAVFVPALVLCCSTLHAYAGAAEEAPAAVAVQRTVDAPTVAPQQIIGNWDAMITVIEASMRPAGYRYPARIEVTSVQGASFEGVMSIGGGSLARNIPENRGVLTGTIEGDRFRFHVVQAGSCNQQFEGEGVLDDDEIEATFRGTSSCMGTLVARVEAERE